MLSNRQTLALSGLLAVAFFVFGILDTLDNFLVLTVLTLLFFAVVINLFYATSRYKSEEEKKKKID